MALTEDEERTLREIEGGWDRDVEYSGSRSRRPRCVAATVKVGLIASELLAGFGLLQLGRVLGSEPGVALGVAGSAAIVAAGFAVTRLGPFRLDRTRRWP